MHFILCTTSHNISVRSRDSDRLDCALNRSYNFPRRYLHRSCPRFGALLQDTGARTNFFRLDAIAALIVSPNCNASSPFSPVGLKPPRVVLKESSSLCHLTFVSAQHRQHHHLSRTSYEAPTPTTLLNPVLLVTEVSPLWIQPLSPTWKDPPRAAPSSTEILVIYSPHRSCDTLRKGASILKPHPFCSKPINIAILHRHRKT